MTAYKEAKQPLFSSSPVSVLFQVWFYSPSPSISVVLSAALAQTSDSSFLWTSGHLANTMTVRVGPQPRLRPLAMTSKGWAIKHENRNPPYYGVITTISCKEHYNCINGPELIHIYAPTNYTFTSKHNWKTQNDTARGQVLKIWIH